MDGADRYNNNFAAAEPDLTKRRDLTFDECLLLMRKRDGQLKEEGFHALQPRAREHLPELLKAFQAETELGLRRWLLELIADARSEDAFPVLCEQALSSNESLRHWGVLGLELLDTKASRTFLFEHGLGRHSKRSGQQGKHSDDSNA